MHAIRVGEQRMTVPPEGTHIQFTCVCTVWGCPHGILVTLPRVGSAEELHKACIERLRRVGWDNDRMGVLCPAHCVSHKIGRAYD